MSTLLALDKTSLMGLDGHSGGTLDMEKGHISLLPYATAEHLIAREEVELV